MAQSQTNTNPLGRIPQTVVDVGAQWRVAATGSAALLWNFSRNLLAYVGAHDVKQRDIAKACGKSESWVSRVLKVARKYENAPKTVEEAAGFLDEMHGNGARTQKSEESAEQTAETALKAAIGFLRAAVKRGMEPDAVVTAVEEALAQTAGTEE